MTAFSMQTAYSRSRAGIRTATAVGIAAALVLCACNAATRPAPEATMRQALPPQPPPVHLAECTGPATSLPDSLARLVRPRTWRAIPDDAWAETARTIPGGFAGSFYDSTHTPILMLTHPELAMAAREALDGRYGFFPFGPVTVRKARWDFAQLVEWFDYLRPRLEVGGITADKDEVINRIRFSVTSIAARDSVVRALSAFPLPCDLVVVDLNGLTNVRYELEKP